MKCPACRKTATLDHFRASPACDAYVRSLCALRSASKRTTVTRAGGRPKKSKETPAGVSPQANPKV